MKNCGEKEFVSLWVVLLFLSFFLFFLVEENFITKQKMYSYMLTA